jgi:hypothetical protein
MGHEVFTFTPAIALQSGEWLEEASPTISLPVTDGRHLQFGSLLFYSCERLHTHVRIVLYGSTEFSSDHNLGQNHQR